MAFGITQNSMIGTIVLNFTAFLEKKNIKFDAVEAIVPQDVLSKKETEMANILEETIALNKDLEDTISLLNRAVVEVKRSTAPVNTGKKYYELLVEKSKRVDTRKNKIRNMLEVL